MASFESLAKTARVRGYAPVLLLLLLAATGPAQAQLLHYEERDGIQFIQAVGTIPNKDNEDDYPDDEMGNYPSWHDNDGDQLDITTDQDAKDECFENFVEPTVSFEFAGSEAWGADVDRVEIGARAAADFGFLRGAVLEYENEDDEDNPHELECSEFEPQWNEYSEPDFGRIYVLPSETLTFEAGNAGTEVRVEDGFELTLLTDAVLNVDGTAQEPVVFKGSQWPGITLGTGVEANLEHCVFRDAAGRGAIRVASGATLNVADCEFRGNEGQFGGAINVGSTSLVSIERTAFRSNEAIRGGALYMDEALPSPATTLRDLTFEGNEALRGGAAYFENNSLLNVENVTFVDNLSGRGGGLAIAGGVTELWNPVIVGNTGRRQGGGLRLTGGADVTLYNPTIAYNEASEGGGIDLSDSGDSLVVNNGIIWGNALRESGEGPQIRNGAGSLNVELRRVLMEGGVAGGYFGSGPATADMVSGTPGFRAVPEAAGEGEGSPQADFHLASDSSAINRGDDSLSSGILEDRDGGDRIFGDEDPRIDLGAYEFPNNPPQLLSTDDQSITVDEYAEPVRIDFCTGFSDLDSHGDDFSSVQEPWLTVAPDAGIEDIDDVDSGAPSNPYGEVRAYDGGSPGDTVTGDNALGDPSGRAYFDPANRSAGYEVTIECGIYDQLTDQEGELDSTLSMLSRGRQSITIQVTARNQPPSFDGSPSSEARVDSSYEEEMRFSDSDLDHRERDVELRLASGPSWLSLSRPDDAVALLSGDPPEEGEFDVEIEVVDPNGGTDWYEYTIQVDPPSELAPVVAGEDQIAEPGDEVSLSAEGPEDPGLVYEWRIVDDAGDQVAQQLGRRFTWTAEQGLLTAIVSIEDGGEVVDEDRLSITVEDGFDGTAGDPESRDEPSAEQEETLGEIESGDADWDSKSNTEKATALEELAGTSLSKEQQDAVIGEAEDLLANAGTPIDSALAEDLAGTMGNLGGLELDPANEQAVVDAAEALRDQAKTDLDDAGYAGVLGAVAGAARTPAAQDTMLAEAAALREGVDPVTQAVAEDLAAAYGGLGRLDLDEERRAELLADVAALRASAEGGGSDALASALIHAGAGVSSAEPLGEQEMGDLLEGLAADLADVAERGGTLDDPTTNVALAAVANAAAAPAFGGAEADAAMDVLDDVLATGTLSATRLAVAATAVAMIADGTSDGGRLDRLRGLHLEIGRLSIELQERLTIVGGQRLKLASGFVPGGASEAITVGSEAPAGPRLFVPAAAVDELRSRNGLASGDAVGFIVLARLPADSSHYVVEIFATRANGQSLGDTQLETVVRPTIPRTSEAEEEPVATGGTPATISNTDAQDKGVSFDTDQFGQYTLTAQVSSDSGGGDSEKSSCFLDSLF